MPGGGAFVGWRPLPGERVALVVGNERYANLPQREQLQKAVNDARAVGSALKQIGFEVIAVIQSQADLAIRILECPHCPPGENCIKWP